MNTSKLMTVMDLYFFRYHLVLSDDNITTGIFVQMRELKSFNNYCVSSMRGGHA